MLMPALFLLSLLSVSVYNLCFLICFIKNFCCLSYFSSDCYELMQEIVAFRWLQLYDLDFMILFCGTV